MAWSIIFHKKFDAEFEDFCEEVQDELYAQLGKLEYFGPSLGRPSVDTLNDSEYANMKELRFSAANGVWRVAFVFDPTRKAILLVAGDKSGVSSKRFYKELLRKAECRYAEHLMELEGETT